jgi:hypothetical protein
MITLFIYSIKSALVLALLYLPYTLMLRQESFFRMNRITLLTILMLALVLPMVDIPSLATPEQPVVYEMQHRIMLMTQEAEMTTKSLAATTRTISWLGILAIVYIIGVILALLIRLWQLFKIDKIIRGGCLWTDKSGKATIYCHIDDVAPFSWMRSIVISEKDYKPYGREILLHEKAHILNLHSMDILFLTLVEAVQWWNPIAYLLGHSLRDVHEYEADDYVLHQGVSLQNYQALLVKKSLANTSYAFANNFNHSLIKKRIYMMNHPKSNPWLRSKVLYILPATLVVLTAFATPKLNEKVGEIVERVDHGDGSDDINPQPEQQPESIPTSDVTDMQSAEPKEELAVKEEAADTLSSEDYVNDVYGDEYNNLTQPPEFPGGMSALRAFVQLHVAQVLEDDASVAGKRAYVQFRIKKDGTIDNIGLVRGDREAYHEAAKIVEQMPKWIPARRFGDLEDAHFVLAVDFNND